MVDNLARQIEILRARMTSGFVQAHQHIYTVEDVIEHEKQGVLRHLQDVQRRLDEARAEMAVEVERVTAAMWGGPPPLPQTPPEQSIPPLEERFTAPRFLRAAE